MVYFKIPKIKIFIQSSLLSSPFKNGSRKKKSSILHRVEPRFQTIQTINRGLAWGSKHPSIPTPHKPLGVFVSAWVSVTALKALKQFQPRNGIQHTNGWVWHEPGKIETCVSLQLGKINYGKTGKNYMSDSKNGMLTFVNHGADSEVLKWVPIQLLVGWLNQPIWRICVKLDQIS